MENNVAFREVMEDINEAAIFYDGLDEAIIGYSETCGLLPVVTYDRLKILEILMEKDGLSYEDAVEHFEYNIIGGHLGEGTPLFFTPIKEAIDGI